MQKSVALIQRKLIEFTNPIKPLRNNSRWLFLCLLLFPFILFLSSCNAFSQGKHQFALTPSHLQDEFMGIRILDTFTFSPKAVNTIPFTEISDLAWDKDDKRLYAISDEGILYHLNLRIVDKKITHIAALKAIKLLDDQGKPFKNKFSDAEGLTLVGHDNKQQGDSRLIISFENKPRISQFDLKGQEISPIKIPNKLKKRKTYRHKNNALESVTHHPQYGVLTAAEKPIKKLKDKQQAIYSATGKTWFFPASNTKNSAITALEVLTNGDVLILERAYSDPFTPIVITLRRLKLEQCNANNVCIVNDIARFDGADGWSLDNFEGLTHIKDNQYLMVSDDNNNPLQNTIWVLFEINP